jgi:alpha-D-xyloside xylohydrolase
LYEDEFDNYNYEKGNYTEIPFHWNEKSKTLTIDAKKEIQRND